MKSGLPYNVMRYRDWDAAPRDPVTITAFLFPNLLAGTVGAFLFTTAVSIGVSLVTSWALSALAPKPKFGDTSSRGILVNAKDPISPFDFVYGETRKGGVVTYYEATGTNNAFLHQIVVLAGHEVSAINDIYLNDEVVTLDGSGFVTSSPWNSKIRIKKYLGTADQAADADLLAESAQITSAFRGRGLAYLYVRYEFDQDVFANGLPLVTAVVRGKKVFDPRTSTTAWSNNAALCVRDYIASSYGLNDDQIDDIDFAAAANICDESVSLSGGGTESRYTINGVALASQSHGDVLQSMMTACAGSLFWGAGKWKLKVGDYVAPTKVLTLDDLRGPISLSTRVNLQDQFNGVKGTFNDAASRWITTDYPPINSAPFEAEDGGEQTMLDLALPFTTSAATAQRLAKLTLFRGREQMTLTADFGLNAFDVEVGEIIALTNPRYGWTEKEFEVVGWNFGNGEAGDLRITLTLRETSEAAFDWSAEETAIIQNNTTLPNSLVGLSISNLAVNAGGRTQSDGTFINSAIFSWDAPANSFVSFYEVEWKPVADSVYGATTTSDLSIDLSPVIDSVEYTFRVRAVTVLGVRGPYSSVQATPVGDTTAPNPPSNLFAEAGYKYITVKFDLPVAADLNRVEVYEATTSSFSGAVSLGFSSGNAFVRTGLGNNATRYYWVRSQDFSGNFSAFVGPVSATTFLVSETDLTQELIDSINAGGVEPVNSLPASGDFDGQIVFLLTDNTLYRWDATASAWSTELFAGIKDLAVTAQKVADNAITVNKIAANAVTTAKIADNAVTDAEIANLAVTAAKVADNAITVSKIASNAVTAAKIADGAATSAKIATSAITETKIASDAITTPKIAAGAVTAGEIAAGAIVAGKIAADAVTAGTVAANAVTAGTIAADAVTTTTIAADAITTAKIAASAVTAGEIAAGAVTAGKIDANAVTAGTIAANAVTAGTIAANAVTATQIAADSITSAKIAAGAVTATEISAGAVTTDKLVASAVVASKIAAGAVTADKIAVNELSAITGVIGTFSSANTGERVVITDDKIEVYDSSNVLRVRIGNLA
jgi:hypothetical protein